MPNFRFLSGSNILLRGGWGGFTVIIMQVSVQIELNWYWTGTELGKILWRLPLLVLDVKVALGDSKSWAWRMNVCWLVEDAEHTVWSCTGGVERRRWVWWVVMGVWSGCTGMWPVSCVPQPGQWVLPVLAMRVLKKWLWGPIRGENYLIRIVWTNYQHLPYNRILNDEMIG